MIKRNFYIKKLDSKKNNGLIKIITGIRRCGKSFLLFTLYKNHLNSLGIDDSHIIQIALDKKQFDDLRNPENLRLYILSCINDAENFYIFIDEIQLSYKIKKSGIDEKNIADDDKDLIYTTFYDVLNDLMSHKNLDIYVTGSNSKMLSKDVATNFRDRGCEIQVFPLSFLEFYEYSSLEKADAWEEYLIYGGLPLAVLEKNENDKAEYLKSLFSRIYAVDIKERYKLKDETALSGLVDVIFSAVGSLTNPHRLNNALSTLQKTKLSDHTVQNYLEYLDDAFIIKKATRYDVKGKSYLNYPSKYYAMDAGLRNAKLNFRQNERNHIMENIIFLELLRRGFSVDVGVVEVSSSKNGVQKKSNLEIDFIVNRGSEKIYIQSAFNIDDEDKKAQEIRPLMNTGDFFKKIVITNGNQKLTVDENGIIYIGVIPFLLDEMSI